MTDAPAELLNPEDLLELSEEDLSALPADIQQQIQEIRSAAEAAAKEESERRQNLVTALGQRLNSEFQRRVGLRREIEERWKRDINRYNGVYEPTVLQALQNRKYGSTMFVPLTRRVCNIVEARLGDLLFPTEDRNYAIDASPVPELAEAENLAKQMGSGEVPAGPNGEAIPASAIQMGIAEVREEAKRKAIAMQREVDDQLREANYGAVGREVIHDGVILGTGVMKGPTVHNRTKKSWAVKDGIGRLTMVEDLTPTVARVSPWNFYPDLAATNLRESASDYERHYLTKTDFAKLAGIPGFDAGAIRRVIEAGPSAVRDENREALRVAAGTQGVEDLKFEVIEYHGPIEPEELKAMGVPVPDDALLVVEGVVWFCTDGTVIKAIANPMATGERPYSVWNWQKDPGCIFGFGLSYEVADLQETGNSAFRAALDNLGLSVGPQIVVNSKDMRPHNGQWVIEPNKLWEITKSGVDARMAFGFHQIDSRTGELLNIFNGVKLLIDEIAGTQFVMQGQDAPSYMQTATAASIAYNASNIWMRRAVRNWDDDITSTTVQRFVDWNMEHNPKPEIKGDLRVIARGTSALLEAEGQVQRIDALMERAKDVPMKFKRRIAQLREMAKAMRIDPADVLPDDEEVREIGEQIDNTGPPPNPEMERIKLRQQDLADREAEREFQWKLELFKHEGRLADIASREQTTVEAARMKYGADVQKFIAQMEDRAKQRAHDAQKFNAELVVKQRMGTGV